MPITILRNSPAYRAATATYVPMVRRKAPEPEAPSAPPPPKVKLKPLKDFKIDHRKDVVERIIRDVAHQYGVSVEDIKSHKRDRMIAWARQDAIFEVYRNVNISQTRLGEYFAREHTTILHSLNRAEERYWIKQAIYKALEGKLNVVLDDWADHPLAQRIPAVDVDRSVRSMRTSNRWAREEATQVRD